MSAYYNEHDPKAAAWLRQLIANNIIPAGEVDERSIEDIRPSDLRGFRQCHFFAGIGGWSEALRLAGWHERDSVWTGSCPCQPFSAAGERSGTADERHLWPAWFYLIEECRPSVVFGEQVDAAIKHGWLDLVQSDLEGAGYAYAAAVVPAAGVGAPHGRHRLWFVADSNGRHASAERIQRSGQHGLESQDGEARELGNAGSEGSRRNAGAIPSEESSVAGQVRRLVDESQSASAARGMVDPSSEQAWISRLARERRTTGGMWADADWIYCSDDKWRPVEPGTFPLAHGLPARMGRLRGYGNAIVPQVAAHFIGAYVAALGE